MEEQESLEFPATDIRVEDGTLKFTITTLNGVGTEKLRDMLEGLSE